MTTGKLSIVATPIGNLEDITLRALRILKEADYILCEDTRVTGKLCSHYEIDVKLKRYDAHTSEKAHLDTINDIKNGKSVVLVSDAGTPGISDPGVLLIAQARQEGLKIEVLPGPSAVTAAVSLAGFKGNQFTFLGFIPQKKGRQTFFDELVNYHQPVLFFESTHRIIKTLTMLVELYPDHNLAIARELTKLHEEFIVGKAKEILTILLDEPVKQKGEFVVIFYPQ